jgi:ABC-2 type transport system ATP-binding protein
MTLFSSQEVTKNYRTGGFTLKKISVSLKPGQITGIIGENGNGKTTLLRIIAGDLSIDSGVLNYFGRESDSVNFTWEWAKQKIAYIPQRIPRWYGSLRKNLIFEATIRGIKGNEADKIVDQLVEQLGLEEYIHLKWKEISTGYRLRFQLAKMLISSPDLLVLDEPIANLDINAQEKFLADLREIVSNKNRKVSVILSSQQLHEIENVSDAIIFLKKGDLVYEGEISKIGENRKENQFEIQGNFSPEELNQLISSAEIKSAGKTLDVKVPLEISSEDFLKLILNENYKIHYFRDISSSTKKLF